MVQQSGITYIVKHKGKKFSITKEDLKLRNFAIVMEYKTADADRRGELFSEYYDLNRPFISYFPQFNGEYRDEIIQIFVSKIPEAFMAYDESKGVDINSYLGMFFKKHAVRDFLYLLPTVQYNKFVRDEEPIADDATEEEAGPSKKPMMCIRPLIQSTHHVGTTKKVGRRRVEKAQMISFDSIGAPGEGGETESGEDAFMGAYVFDEFLNGDQRDGDEKFLEGASSYSRYFSDPQIAEIVRDFEDGLRFNEVMDKHKLSIDRFLSTMAAVRMQLTRILKQEGKDVRFVTKQERGARKQAAVARENQRANAASISRNLGASKGIARLLEFINGCHAEPAQRDEGYRPKTPLSMEDIWGQEGSES